MKRNFVKIAIVVAIVAVSGINVFNAQKPEVLSDVAMENVEALADYEDGTDLKECEGHIRVCEQEREKFFRDLYNNCDVFKGTIEWIDCPNLV